MKKITLMIAALAATISMNAQNPFVQGMIFSSTTIACAGNENGGCDPANSDLEFEDEIYTSAGDNADNFVISDITGGLYEQGYGSSPNPVLVTVDSDNMTLTVTDSPDVVYGGDVFNATGSYTVNGDGEVTSFSLDWTNGFGDQGTTDFTYESTSTVIPGPATNPMPEDGATDLEIDGTMGPNGEEPRDFIVWEVDAPTETGDSDIIGYDVYISAANETELQLDYTAPANTGYILRNLEENSTYKWAVIPRNAAGAEDVENVTVWTFTTGEKLGVDNVETPTTFSHFITNNETLEVEAQQTIKNVQLFNLLGQQVATKQINTTKGNINISNLSAGVYLAQVNVSGKLQTFKFVKK